jgi:hypothetical protein
MTFIRLNGWRVPASIRTSPRGPTKPFGELRPRIRNLPVRHRRSIEREFRVRTPKVDEFCADTIEGLLEGLNHQFPFVVDAWSMSGLGPEDGSSWTLSSSGGPTATRGHFVTVGVGDLVYDPRFIDDPVAPDGGRWTVIWWQLVSGAWNRYSLRSTGEKTLNGAPTSLTLPSGIVVSNGSVAFTNGAQIADLVLLSFYACDDYLSQEYDWVSGFGMAHRWSLNNTYADSLGAVSALSNLTSFAKGPVRRGVDFDPGEYLYGLGAVGVGIDGLSEITVMGWVDLNATRPAFNTVFDLRLVGPTTDKFFFGYRTSGVAVVGARSSAADFSSQRVFTTSPVYSFGATGRQHWACSVDLVTNTNRIWINGVEQSVSGTPAYAGTVFSGGCVNGFISYDVADNDVDGVVDEVKVFHRGLTTAQVLAIYNTERKGQPYPGPRFSSAFPRVDLWGDIDGCREPVEVIGELDEAAYVQHGSSTGWVNNAREVSMTLHQVKHRPARDQIPRPDLAVSMSSKSIRQPQTASAAPQPFSSKYFTAGVGLSFSNRGRPGPFNFYDEAMEFSVEYMRINDPDAGTFLAGASGATILAWVRPSSLASAAQVVEAAVDNVNNPRLGLRMTGGGSGAWIIDARSEAADATQAASSINDLVVDEWRLIGGTIDLPAAEIRPYNNGTPEPATGSLVFGSTTFNQDSPTSSPYMVIGRDDALGDQWQGQIAGVYLWRRVLTPGEIRRVYDLGRQGVFR